MRIALALLILLPATAIAAEATLPIKAKIIRCVTDEEREAVCEEMGLCCDLTEWSVVQLNTF